MGLFDMCCPKKPKKSLDYVIKWIEDADKTLSNINASIAGINSAISALQGDIKDLEDWKSTIESSISDLVTEAIEDYDWSQLPVDALQAKADKVENAVAGHFAFLDANGNLVDSGVGIDTIIEEDDTDLVPSGIIYEALQGKADKVVGATAGNLAGLDENGNLTDSGKKASDFAPVVHHHDDIIYQDSDGVGRVYTTSSEEYGGEVNIIVKKGNGNYKSAMINDANINNLIRALEDPEAPTQGSDKLITSGQVYTALQGINANSISVASHGQASSVTTELGRLGEGPSVTIALTQSLQPVSAEINISNINNLIRALNTPYQGISGTEDNLVNGTYLLQVIGNTISNNTDVNNYIYLFKDDGQGGTQDYIVTGDTTAITSLNNFILNNTSNKLHTYYVLFASNEITNDELIVGYARWIFWTNNTDQSYWKVFLYVGDKTFTAKCTVADVVQEADVENYAANWSNWTKNEIA